MIKKIIISFLLVPILLAFAGQDDMELLRSVFKNISQQSTLNPDQVFYMNYSLSTYNVDTTEQPVNSTIEVWTKNKLVEIKNAQMQVYQDEKEAFIVLPVKQLIMRNDAVTPKKGSTAANKTLVLYDSLLQYSRIVSSESVKAKDYDRRISIAVNEKGQQLLGVGKADYYIDSKVKTVKKVRIYYASESAQYKAQIAYVDYIINKMEYDYKGKKMNSNVASNFIKDNKLNQSYKSYKLIDNRAGQKNN